MPGSWAREGEGGDRGAGKTLDAAGHACNRRQRQRTVTDAGTTELGGAPTTPRPHSSYGKGCPGFKGMLSQGTLTPLPRGIARGSGR